MSVLPQDVKDEINRYKYNKQIAKMNSYLKEIMDSQVNFFENIKQYAELYVRASLNNADNDTTKDGKQNEDQTKYLDCKAAIEREIETIQNTNEEVLKNVSLATQYKLRIEPYTKQMGPLYNENSPKSMLIDITQLYNIQYLHLFCKFLGIVIILILFYSFFSSRPSSSFVGAPVSPPSSPIPMVNS